MTLTKVQVFVEAKNKAGEVNLVGYPAPAFFYWVNYIYGSSYKLQGAYLLRKFKIELVYIREPLLSQHYSECPLKNNLDPCFHLEHDLLHLHLHRVPLWKAFLRL